MWCRSRGGLSRLREREPSKGNLVKARKQSIPISGKRKRKLLKKSRREQKEAMKLGLEIMEGVEVAAPQVRSAYGIGQNCNKVSRKKSVKIKQLKPRDKKQKRKSSSTGSEAAVDVMVE